MLPLWVAVHQSLEGGLARYSNPVAQALPLGVGISATLTSEHGADATHPAVDVCESILSPVC